MDKKASLLRFACVLISLEVAVMVASMVAFAMSTPGAEAGVAAKPSLLGVVSDWLMLCHNLLEVCVYAVLAWLVGADNRAYAIAGFVFGVLGLAALSGSILIEIELWPSPSDHLQLHEPFGIGYGSIEVLLGLIGAFCILPANGFFALATLGHPRSRPAVPAVLFIGIPIGLMYFFVQDNADAGLRFLGDWLVPTFVVAKQLILLWWFTTLLQPVETPKRAVSTGFWITGLPEPSLEALKRESPALPVPQEAPNAH
jgi:hypothetical protein